MIQFLLFHIDTEGKCGRIIWGRGGGGLRVCWPPPKLLGRDRVTPCPPPHPSFYAYVLKRLKISDCEIWFKYTAPSDDMQIMRTATPNLFLNGIMPLCYKHVLFFYKLCEMLVIVMRGTDR